MPWNGCWRDRSKGSWPVCSIDPYWSFHRRVADAGGPGGRLSPAERLGRRRAPRAEEPLAGFLPGRLFQGMQPPVGESTFPAVAGGQFAQQLPGDDAVMVIAQALLD